MDQGDVTGAVVPLDVHGSAGDIAKVDPWALLASGDGVLVTWHDVPKDGGRTWGPELQATSALAQQLTSIATRAGGTARTAGSVLFRVEVPTGYTLQNLVPAVGGGFRGLVRSGASPSIAGQARLVPVTGAAAAGAGIALGPLVALMALSVGAEMLARRQQDKKLEAIQREVGNLQKDADETVAAQLKSAGQAIELACGALLDHVAIPDSIGLGAARDNLRVIKNRALSWLDDWEDRAKTITGRDSVSFDGMRHVLAGPDSGNDYLRFPQRVRTLYEALVLDTRALVIHAAEASAQKPDDSLPNLEQRLQSSLRQNAAVQERLRELLWALAEIPVSKKLAQRASTDRATVALDRTIGRLASAASRFPDAPPLLNAANRQILEVVREPNGRARVLSPAARD